MITALRELLKSQKQTSNHNPRCKIKFKTCCSKTCNSPRNEDFQIFREKKDPKNQSMCSNFIHVLIVPVFLAPPIHTNLNSSIYLVSNTSSNCRPIC